MVTTRILVVDDDAMNREIMEAYLLMEQYEVALANNGRQALKLVPEFKPALVILDVNMPDMNGYEVCRRLRADASLTHLRIMIITGYSDKDEQQKGLAAGADAFLTRPFDGDVLLAQIRRLLETVS